MTREEVLSRVQVGEPDECWIWSGAKTSHGYGVVRINGQHWYTHRLAVGEIPEGKIVMHTCDNPSCVNPNHLRVGTQSDNMQDCVSKGRQNHPSSAKTHCKRGHEFTPENTYFPADGSRQCRECRRMRDRVYYARRH